MKSRVRTLVVIMAVSLAAPSGLAESSLTEKNMALPFKPILYVVCVCSVLACSRQRVASKENTASTNMLVESAATVPPKAKALKAGDHCNRTDGFQLASFEQTPSGTDAPVGMTPPPGWVDFFQLSPGVRYCLAPGGKYPFGYFTSNCHSSGDCEAGAECDGSLCRAPWACAVK
jgi:hypothetical protein